MSQTPSISFERDIYRSQPMASRRLRFASDGQLELNVIGVNDAVFDVPPVVVIEQKTLESPGSFRNVVLRTYQCVNEVGFQRLQRQLRIWWMG